MRWQEVALLDEAGFSLYEKRALVSLGVLGVADAASICREGDIPTSKIYLAMEKLARLGLCETQQTRPKLYSAMPPDLVVDRLVELARERAEDFAARSSQLRRALAALPGRLRGRQTFVDLALGTESHVKRHLVRLAAAKTRTLSYMEHGDLAAIDGVAKEGFNLYKRVTRTRPGASVERRIVFGFSDRTAPQLLRFLREYGASMGGLSSVRYSGELGHPFHVIDDDTVILSLDHPFIPEGRFASLLVRDASLAESLAQGFDTLWQKALRDLREIRFYPRRSRSSV